MESAEPTIVISFLIYFLSAAKRERSPLLQVIAGCGEDRHKRPHLLAEKDPLWACQQVATQGLWLVVMVENLPVLFNLGIHCAHLRALRSEISQRTLPPVGKQKQTVSKVLGLLEDSEEIK